MDVYSVEMRGDDMFGCDDIFQVFDGISGEDVLQGDGSGDLNKDWEFLQDFFFVQVDFEQFDGEVSEGFYVQEQLEYM